MLLVKYKENIQNIYRQKKLVQYLKNKCVGYRPKKSKVLTKADIEEFLHRKSSWKYIMILILVTE